MREIANAVYWKDVSRGYSTPQNEIIIEFDNGDKIKATGRAWHCAKFLIETMLNYGTVTDITIAAFSRGSENMALQVPQYNRVIVVRADRGYQLLNRFGFPVAEIKDNACGIIGSSLF